MGGWGGEGGGWGAWAWRLLRVVVERAVGWWWRAGGCMARQLKDGDQAEGGGAAG